MAVLLVVVGASAGCSDDSAESCAALRARFARLYPAAGSSTEWQDIQALQLNVEEGAALQSRIAERCAPSD
jgi:hypothetical protein